jgi:NADH-quinone oxidoreductase subunit M
MTGPIIILACALTLLVAPRIATREHRGWIRESVLALLLALAVFATNGVLAFAAVATIALVIGAEALRSSRTASVMLALSAAASAGAAAALAAGQPHVAFVASIVAFALRTGIFPLHGGVAALTERNLALQVQQIATLPVMVLLHLRFASEAPWAVELAPYIVAIGTASTLGFALVAIVQRTLRGLLRASMLMHGGMLFAAVGAAGNGHHAAAMFVAVTFGLALSGFAIMLASFEARVGPLTQLGPGGVARAFPRLAAAIAIFGAAAVGLPGTAGFAADDLLLHALWQESATSTVLMIVASALLAVATLAGFARAFLGRPIRQLAPDLLGRERLVVVGLVGWLIVLGFAPSVLASPVATMLP